MSVTQDAIIADLPPHLRPFVRQQEPGRYTARDHAVWRFLMAHLVRALDSSAHPVYREGLKKTGIALDHIPSIDEMNTCLARLGWRAVVVDGFIPPAIFMEFQALRVLVIALDMRSVDHMLYTPAPDILHESAGHAPFLVDVDYSEFLQRFGEIGMKAIASEHDFAQYEAIRRLSILKESPNSSPAEIVAAESELQRLSEREEKPSEAALLTRLHWWTVEYGLVGDVDDYHLFGAGLLSSLGESARCLDDRRVQKLPLTVDAVTFPYDITVPQPQLFVTGSCKHLSQVLEEFAASMAFRRGGTEGLKRAIEAGTVCTAELDSGVQVSGRFTQLRVDAVGNPIYFQTTGPTQVAHREREVYGHGIDRHPDGLGSPVGLLRNFSRCLSDYTVDELRAHGIALDTEVTLEFLSGITVRGLLRDVIRQEHRNLILGFERCLVTDWRGNTLFEPGQGRYDMVVGARVVSVFGGTADRSSFRLYEPMPGSTTTVKPPPAALMQAYARVSPWPATATRGPLAADEVDQFERVLDEYPREWLLRYELLAASPQLAVPDSLKSRALSELRGLRDDPELAEPVALALEDSRLEQPLPA